jgi:exopolysaccharide production protein ExoQ
MFQSRFQKISDILLIFNASLFSNYSAFFVPLWLSNDLLIFQFIPWVLMAIITMLLLYKEKMIPFFLNNLMRNWNILPFIIFSGFSVAWSVYWEISLYRWLLLVFSVIIGGYIGLKYDLKKILRLLSLFGIYILLFAGILILFVPDIGVHNYYDIIQGAWKGPYWHKNHMGLIATFINILFLTNTIYSLLFEKNKKNIYLWGGPYLLSFLFIYQSDSIAAYMTTIFLHGMILLALFLLKFGKKLHRFHYLIFFAVFFIAAIILFSNLDFIFGIFNRNTSLTGRIPLWKFISENYLSRQPLIGYGFNAFWYIESHQVTVQQAVGYRNPVIIADNGFIDILINNGYLGFVLFLIFYFGLWWRSMAFARKSRDIIGVFPVILMAYTLIANISWSLMFENEGFFMLIMITVMFSISRISQPYETSERGIHFRVSNITTLVD